jgi:alkylation response protein AidB-like acyl-CoA dehydrogenase
VDAATAALCAEAVGAMERASEITLEYLKTREQFGQKFGKFQALQHRMVDLFMEAEAVALDYDRGDADVGTGTGGDQADALAGEAAHRQGGAAGTQGVQLHGGMGMTEEYPIGHYYRRLLVIETMFGNTAFHRTRLARALQAEPMSP